MVGLIDPRAPPSPRKSDDKQRNEKLQWHVSPLIRLAIRPEGRYSSRADEHCFAWCTQASYRRTHSTDPTCRAICIRRVFKHEVQQITSQFSSDAILHSQTSGASAGKKVDKRLPLPVEGQPPDVLTDGIMFTPEKDGNQSSIRYWEEGWYIWATKSRLAITEKLDMMGTNLQEQTDWMFVKQRSLADAMKQANLEQQMGSTRHEIQDSSSVLSVEANAQQAHAFALVAQESFLVRIPTSFSSLNEYAMQKLKPARKVLNVVEESFRSGDQRDFAFKLWDTARSGAPIMLIKNAFKVWVDSFGKGPKDNND